MRKLLATKTARLTASRKDKEGAARSAGRRKATVKTADKRVANRPVPRPPTSPARSTVG
jgi:hypothetical protein